jgi:HK97 family phage major capsid protein
MLLGFPVRMSEYSPNTFTTGLYVGILGDFSNYWIAELQGLMLKRLDELYQANGQTGFKLTAWADGMPVLEEAFARVKLG